VISTGEFKGAGAPGSKITDKQLAHFHSVVTASNELFLKDVARGRKIDLSRVRKLGDGRVHLAESAARLGLIDSVSTMDAALDELVSMTKTKSPVRSATRSSVTSVLKKGDSTMTHQDIDPRQQWAGNAEQIWKQKIQEFIDSGMSKRDAVVKVDINNPGLREQYLEEWKPQPKHRFSNQTVRSY